MGPFSFSWAKSLFQFVKSYSFGNFNLSIGLRVIYWTGDVLDIEFLIKLSESPIDELPTVVSDDDMRYPKMAYDILPY